MSFGVSLCSTPPSFRAPHNTRFKYAQDVEVCDVPGIPGDHLKRASLSTLNPSPSLNPRDKAKCRKTTKDETAAKLYRREQRRFAKEQHKISLANGYAVSPPRPNRADSTSPPRRVPRPYSYAAPPSGRSRTDPILVESDDEDSGQAQGSYSWNNGASDVWEEEERLAYLAEGEMARENPFSDYISAPHPAIPKRYQYSQPSPAGKPPKKRDPAKEVQLDGGPIPNIAGMSETEYTEFIRAGMDRIQRQAESSFIARQNAERVAKERERQRVIEAEEEVARKAEKKRRKKIQQAQADAARKKEEQDVWVFHDFKKAAREHYRARWSAITKVGGEIEEVRIGYGDIPWPVYYPAKGIEKGAVRDFVVDLSKENGEDLKKGLREAIRAFHPDRFFGRILPRTNEHERDKVRESVEACIRVINDLLAETRT